MSEKNRYNDFDTFIKDVVAFAKVNSNFLKKLNKIPLPDLINPLDVIGSIFKAGANFILKNSKADSALWRLYRDRKIAMEVIEIKKLLKPSWELLLRKHAGKEDFDRLYKEAETALLVDPVEFYRTIRKPEDIEKMFQDFMNYK